MSTLYTSSTYKKVRKDGNGYYYYNYVVELDSQDANANTSTITTTMYMWRTLNNGTLQWNTTSARAPYATIEVNGVTTSGSKITSYSNSTTHMSIVSKTQTITHDSDGEKTISPVCKWVAGSGTTTSYYPASFSTTAVSIALPSLGSGSILSIPSSVTIDNLSDALVFETTAIGDYYHNLTMTVDGNTVPLLSAQYYAAGIHTYSLQYSVLLTYITSTDQATATIVLDTYEDQACTTLVGSRTYTTDITVTYAPTLTLTLTPATTPYTGKAIAGYSTGSIAFTTASPGSTVMTVTLAGTNCTLPTSSYSSNTDTYSDTSATDTLTASSSDYTITIVATATDSRGLSTSATATMTVYGYTKPKVSVSGYRVATNGSTTEDSAGEYAYVVYSGTIRSFSVEGNSINSLTYSYSMSGGTSGSGSAVDPTITNSAWIASFGLDQRITVTITATDDVGSDSTSLELSTAVFALELYEDSGHLGVGLAGVEAEADKIKFGTNTYIGNTGGHYITDSNATDQPVILSDSSDNVQVNAIGANLQLGAQNTSSVNVLSSAFQFLTGGEFISYADANSSDADDLYPSTDMAVKAYYASSATGRSNWPTTRARAIIVSWRQNASYGIQFCWGNTDKSIYMRYLSAGTWVSWLSITFS